jgi:hypothetical protein
MGFVAAGTSARAMAYRRIAGIASLTLAVVGLLTPSGFGLVPLGGHDIWLHTVLGGTLTVVGFLDPGTAAAARH